MSLGRMEFEVEYGKTPALLLRLSKAAKLWGTGKCLFMDSAFSVLDALLALKARGVHSFIVIKKKRYWPRHVPGDGIVLEASTLTLGTARARKGMGTTDGCSYPFFIAALRDSSHVFMCMSTFGTLLNTGKKVSRGPHSFERPQVYDEYYVARHSVDDNNNLRQGHRGIEEAWETRSWAHRNLAFLISLAEVNGFRAMSEFANPNMKELMTFRRAIVDEAFLANRAVQPAPTTRSSPKKRASDSGHTLLPIPPKKKRYRGVWVDAPELKGQYPQWRCSVCHKKARYYCSCNADKGFCQVCFGSHRILEVS